MVDIEPMLKYDYSNFGIKNVYGILFSVYIAFIYPITTILNYDLKNEKEIIRDIVTHCISKTKCSIYKVSKGDLIIEKDIMYMTNHTSVGDFFIDPYLLHYNTKIISLNKARIMLPIMGLICMLTSSSIFVGQGNSKEKIIENFKQIEELRKSDDIRNITLYPEGLRRPHRHTVSATIKKGFIYHSFENSLPIQLIHTTNKDYVIDEEKFMLHKNTKLFTYYSPKIDPCSLRSKFEKKHSREYTKEDYYNDVYKKWSKIWSKMDKYRIDTLRSQGLPHEDCLEKMNHYTTKFPPIEDKILNGDKPLSASFLLLRSICWATVYFIIFKIIEKCFSCVSYIYKQPFLSCSKSCDIPLNTSSIPLQSRSCSFSWFKLPLLSNFIFSNK